MSAVRRNPSTSALDARRVAPVLATTLLIGIGIAVLDLALVRVASGYKSESGIQLFQSGLAAQKRGDAQGALESFRAAHNHNPSNSEYHLAFAKALESTGRSAEARAALEQLLDRQPAYGPANVEMARVLARSGEWQRAAWYYHRALYGQWTGQPDLRSLRFELADLLASRGAREELASEVALLANEPLDPGASRRLAALQLAAGDWKRAEDRYTELLRASPQDPELLAGRASAYMGERNFTAAERDLRRAVTAGGPDASIQRELDLVVSINAIDPTMRRLDVAEKHRRAHELLTSLVNALEQCAPGNPEWAEERARMKRHEGTRKPGDAAEQDLDDVERLWNARGRICRAAPLHVPNAVASVAEEVATR